MSKFEILSVLGKAEREPLEYLLQTKSGARFKFGELVRFGEPTDDGWIQWVHLKGSDAVFDEELEECRSGVGVQLLGDGTLKSMAIPRGVNIRVSEIEWIADVSIRTP